MSVTTPWRSLIRGLAGDVEFATGAAEDRISLAERTIGVAFPDALRTLLTESDGVRADFGEDVAWSCAEIVKRNLEFRRYAPFRELYMPFDYLLFIGADGGGDQFAFAIAADGRIPNADIYRWDHETDGRPWYAGGLQQYFERRLGPPGHR